MSSIPRCEAASISTTSSELPFAIATHTGHVLSGVGDGPGVPGAVERLREDPRHRRLARPARPGEEVRLAHLIVLDRVLQRPDDRLLPDDLVEPLRAVLPVERRHPADSSRCAVVRPILAYEVPRRRARRLVGARRDDQTFHGAASVSQSCWSRSLSRSVSMHCQNAVVPVRHQLAVARRAARGARAGSACPRLDVVEHLRLEDEEPAVDPAFAELRLLRELDDLRRRRARHGRSGPAGARPSALRASRGSDGTRRGR